MKKIISLLLLLQLSACAIVVPIINGFKELGATGNSRQEMLAKDIRMFNNLLASSSAQRVSMYVIPEQRAKILRMLVDKDTKIVDGKSIFVDFSEDSREANVEYVIRSYKVPYYVVQEFNKILVWKFDGGWKIHEIKDASPNN